MYERHTKRDTDTHTHILEVQSCHHTEKKEEEEEERNQTNNKNMLTFHVKIDIINIYKEEKEDQSKENIHI